MTSEISSTPSCSLSPTNASNADEDEMQQAPAKVRGISAPQIGAGTVVLRRSPRSAPPTVHHESKTSVDDSEKLRRSPRFSSSSPNGNVENLHLKGQSLSLKHERVKDKVELIMKVTNMSASKSGELRGKRSPRFVGASKNGGSNGSSTKHVGAKVTNMSASKSSELRGKGTSRFVGVSKNKGSNGSLTKVETYELSLSIGMTLRRSPRNNKTIESGSSEKFLETCYKTKSGFSRLVDHILSSSLTHGIESGDVDGAKSIVPKPFCIESFHASDGRPSKRFKTLLNDSDEKVLDEKFQREYEQACISQTIEVSDRCNNSSMHNTGQSINKIKGMTSLTRKKKKSHCNCSFIGDPISSDEAQAKWHWRYELKMQRHNKKTLPLDDDDDEDKIVWNVECHYAQARIAGCVINPGDCVYVKGEKGQKHIGRILEFFRTTDGEDYFRVHWFYKAQDTVMKEEAAFHDKRRLFYSTVMNDNPIDCIISKVNVMHIASTLAFKSNSTLKSDFYFDMEYCVEYSTFRTLLSCDVLADYNSLCSSREYLPRTPTPLLANINTSETTKSEFAVLDIYSGCGGMSTGLCLGAKASGINMITKWAVDSDSSACESLKLNHPETHVRNEPAEDFLMLLKEWEKLCKKYAFDVVRESYYSRSAVSTLAQNCGYSVKDTDSDSEELEVQSLVDICYGDPFETGKRGLYFKVHWKGYSADEDTWEPIKELSNCQDVLREFVRNGFKSKILPLRGDVDVICGGPPCQGISGYNRFRMVDSPLDDERNRQIVIFMNIVEYLNPKYVLMENVTDILRFNKASLGRYALSRLVSMRYQARLGTIAAGCYGLPQFRLRVFLWGAQPTVKLPQFPLPTHDVIVRYWPPSEFERNTVAYDEGQPRELEEALVLRDAISDLPAVTNDETREEMTYNKPPDTEFQRFIRADKDEMSGSSSKFAARMNKTLYDHRPYPLFEDDYTRVCLIPKRKGANFRDLPGIYVGEDNVVRRDPKQEQKMLPSGKPLVPGYVFTFEQGKSKRPFARLWWDETVPTVVTFPTCHSQAALHPEQDRVLTIREYARLQGFPDYYRFCGTIKDRYCQVGNAVAVPVARALGYALGLAIRNLSGNEPLMTLPPKFSLSTNTQAELLLPKVE